MIIPVRAPCLYAPKYADTELPNLPAVEANAFDLAQVLTNSDLVGIPEENVHLVYADNPMMVALRLADLAEQAQKVLLVYYAGHGLLGPDNKLYLATYMTTQPRIMFNGLPYGAVPKGDCGHSGANQSNHRRLLFQRPRD